MDPLKTPQETQPETPRDTRTEIPNLSQLQSPKNVTKAILEYLEGIGWDPRRFKGLSYNDIKHFGLQSILGNFEILFRKLSDDLKFLEDFKGAVDQNNFEDSTIENLYILIFNFVDLVKDFLLIFSGFKFSLVDGNIAFKNDSGQNIILDPAICIFIFDIYLLFVSYINQVLKPVTVQRSTDDDGTFFSKGLGVNFYDLIREGINYILEYEIVVINITEKIKSLLEKYMTPYNDLQNGFRPVNPVTKFYYLVRLLFPHES